ncbi:hypothetical protein P7C73_g3900, partial [Tremellales sp. Uapishka_1]
SITPYLPQDPSSPIHALLSPTPHALSSFLLEKGFIVRPVVPPTVPPGGERVRICLRAGMDKAVIEGLVGSLEQWVRLKSRENREPKKLDPDTSMTVQHPTAVVFSSTGTQGLSVTKALSQAGYTIRALTRSPSSAKTISAFQGLKNVVPTLYDHADPSNLPRILAGAQIVYAIPVPDDPAMMASPGSPESISKLPSEKQQGITIADAVQGAGTPLLIWGSAPDAAAASKGAYPSIPTFQDKIEVQEYITSLGLESVYIALGVGHDCGYEIVLK